ncbi:hypothetical protein EYF80_025752 [Liparis tanakae]|uniref:Uncharacterized protein n=1 Tax=Liparis tanakae TaxID=230148 RepID=A0A4Z2HDV2_9TELE|nr:hypothetical protein EYF80_025752 [Liparis tanakae]
MLPARVRYDLYFRGGVTQKRDSWINQPALGRSKPRRVRAPMTSRSTEGSGDGSTLVRHV